MISRKLSNPPICSRIIPSLSNELTYSSVVLLWTNVIDPGQHTRGGSHDMNCSSASLASATIEVNVQRQSSKRAHFHCSTALACVIRHLAWVELK